MSAVEQYNHDYAPYTSIFALSYYISGSEENRIDSSIEIENKDLFHGDLPAEGGIYDSHMGTTDKSWRCGTCGNTKGNCPGHTGHIELNYPVKNPMWRDSILKFLKVICFRCGRLIITKEIKVSRNKRLMEYARIVTTDKVSVCPYGDCKEPHPTVIHDKTDPAIIYIERTNSFGKIEREELFNHIIGDIFSRINDETLEKIGWVNRNHPRNLILNTIKIVPNTARPYIKRQLGTNINSSDDITTLTKQIVEINVKLPKEIPKLPDITKNLRDLYGSLDMTYYEMVKGSTTSDINMTGSGKKEPNALVKRMKGKTGRIRINLLGKRTRFMARSVLSCCPEARTNVVTVPLSIAKYIQINEIVGHHNIHRLNVYFKNKHDIYPGCTHIWKKNRNEKYLVDKVQELEIGDVIYRDLVDGDTIIINRQPSLMYGSMIGMKVKTTSEGDSLRINESACHPLNADFDGDAVNGIICRNIMARVELEELSALKKIFISRQKHSPYFGCFQDSLIGTAQLTRSYIRLNKWHAMMLFSNILLENNLDINFDKKEYKGREIIGRFLPKINYPKKAPQMYNPDYSPFIKYDPEEIVVEINRGELVSGILDKKSVGQGKHGTVFHIINNEYGPQRALDTLDNFHQIIMKFYLWNGATIGMKDVVLPDHAINIIHQKTAMIMKEANDLTELAHKRELIPPIGTPISKYYETEIMTKLSTGDEYIEPIYSNIDTDEGLAQLVTRGSKGDAKNAMAIYAAIGQVTIGSNRITKNFSKGRTSVYFLRGDKSPRANGFIDNSYREGIESDIYPFVAAEARYNEIMKALSTSVAGAQGRICTRNIESILVGNLRNSVKGDSILQLLYADTGIDPSKVEYVKFLTALIGDKKLESEYKSIAKNFDKIYHNKNVEAVLEQEYECIKNDRQLFRDIAFKLHNGNIGKNGLISNERYMPINPYRIIEDVLYTYRDEVQLQSSIDKRFDPVKAIDDVVNLCKDISYCYFNEIYKKEGQPIPEYIDQSLTLVKILIRSYLCTANLLKKGVTNKLLNIIIEKIKKTFKKSLIPYGLAVGVIAAQCISEPQTQYVIDSKLRAGTGGGNKTSSIDRIKEIFGAKKTEEMKNTSMIIMLKEEYSKNKSIVQDVANNIEMMNFDRFVTAGQIFFETYGEPIHPDYKHEVKMIKDFEKYNHPDIPTNLSKWCLRYEINKEELFINGMKMATIIFNLQLKYPDVFFVYTPENADNIIVRAYLTNQAVKIGINFTEQVIIDYMNKMMDTTIRGIRGIIYTEVNEISVSKIMEDGSIANVKEWAIETNGTNLEDVLEHPMVDRYRTQTDSIDEMLDMYGIECTRIKIVKEVQKTMTVDDAPSEHTMIISDEMCNSGTMTSIQKTGLQSRDAGNIGLQLSFQAPIQVIEKAASSGIHEIVSGISSNFILGQVPNVGTTYNDVILDEAFVEKWYSQHNDRIEQLL